MINSNLGSGYPGGGRGMMGFPLLPLPPKKKGGREGAEEERDGGREEGRARCDANMATCQL